MRTMLPATASVSHNELLAKAAEMSGKYDWTAAAGLYFRAFKELDPEPNTSEAARIAELLAKSYFKAAFQSETRDEFKSRMQRAGNFYERAGSLYESVGLEGFFKRARARYLFSTFWLAELADDRRGMLDDCIQSANEAARDFEDKHENERLAETHLDLLSYLREIFWLAREWKQVNEISENGIKISERAVKGFEVLGKDEGLLESLNAANWFSTFVAYVGMNPSRFEELDKACRGITSRLADLAKKVSTPHAACLAAEAAGWQGNNRGGEALSFLEAGLVSAESVKDSYLTGRMYLGAAVAAFWSFDEDVERRRALLEKVAAYSAAAIEKLRIPPHDPLGIAYLWHAESKTALARE